MSSLLADLAQKKNQKKERECDLDNCIERRLSTVTQLNDVRDNNTNNAEETEDESEEEILKLKNFGKEGEEFAKEEEEEEEEEEKVGALKIDKDDLDFVDFDDDDDDDDFDDDDDQQQREKKKKKRRREQMSVKLCLERFEKQGVFVQKAFDEARKSGFNESDGDEEEDDEDELDEEITFLREMLEKKSANKVSFNIPSAKDIIRVVEARLSEIRNQEHQSQYNESNENNNKWVFMSCAAAATEAFAEKKLEKAREAFENATQKAKTAAEKLQFAERALQISLVLEMKQKPNGAMLIESKIGMRMQRREMRKKLKKEFGEAASSDDDSDDDNTDRIPHHQRRDPTKNKVAPKVASQYIQKVVWKQPDACHVCNEPIMDYWDVNDQILLCDGCDAQVHASCYGIENIPDGEWLCAGCEDGVSNLIENGRGMCALCPVPRGVLARIKPKSKFPTNWRAPGYHAHVACALTLPEISFTKETDALASEKGSSMLRIDVSKLTSTRMSLKCEICQEEGACTQCSMNKCYKAFHPLCARGTKNSWLRRAGTGQPMVFCSTHSGDRWLQKRREICLLPLDTDVNDAYLTGGTVFWGLQNAAASQSNQLQGFIAKESVPKFIPLVNKIKKPRQVIVENKVSEKVVSIPLNNTPKSSAFVPTKLPKKKGKPGAIEGITTETVESIVFGAKSSIGRAIAIMCSYSPAILSLYEKDFVEIHLNQTILEEVYNPEKLSLEKVIKTAYGALEISGTLKYTEPWKLMTVAQRVVARDMVTRNQFLGIALTVLDLPSGFGKRLSVLASMSVQGDKPHVIICDDRLDALNWIADLAKFCPKLRQIAVLNNADACNQQKCHTLQKSSFDVLVATSEIFYEKVLKSDMSTMNRNRSFASASFDGWSGFEKWKSHFDDETFEHCLKTKRVVLMRPPPSGENFRELFQKIHKLCSEASSVTTPVSVWAQSDVQLGDSAEKDEEARKMLTVIVENELMFPTMKAGEFTTESMRKSFVHIKDIHCVADMFGAFKFANTIATHSIARTLLVLNAEFDSDIQFRALVNKFQNDIVILDPTVENFGARLVDAVAFKDTTKPKVGIVSLNGLKKAPRLTRGTHVCVLFNCDAKEAEDIVIPKLAHCETRANDCIPLVFLNNNNNMAETKKDEKEEEEDIVVRKIVSDIILKCEPKVELRPAVDDATIKARKEEEESVIINKQRPKNDPYTVLPPEHHDNFCYKCKSVDGCKAIPPAWLPVEAASMWLQCSKCPNAGSAGCARVLATPKTGDPWTCPAHKCAVCGDKSDDVINNGDKCKTTLRCVECGYAYCDTCSSGAEFEKAERADWFEKFNFVLPLHSEYVKCGVCCAASKEKQQVIVSRKRKPSS